MLLPEHRPYIIAEAGVNHDGKVEKALQLIEVAAEARADAVKFQLFDPDEIVSADTPLADYQERSGEEDQHTMLRRLALPREAYRLLKTHAGQRNIDFITTPFDTASAQFLADLGVAAIKIPSGEITNLPFLRSVASLRIFTIISTGMATLEEVREATEPFTQAGIPYALLHCVSAYPAPRDQINLRAMETLRREFGVPVGYSDHTKGTDVAVTAALLGAQILEKHFTMRKSDPGPDHAASLEPEELREMVRRLRHREKGGVIPPVPEALGTGEKTCQPCEENVRAVARRSVVLTQTVPAGTVLTARMLTLKRPGTGIAPKFLSETIGKRVSKELPAGTILTPALIS